MRRRGNALNELGVFYLNQAAAAVSESGKFNTFFMQYKKFETARFL